MNLTRAMTTFVAVCDNSGFAAAGRALNLSKALVSKRISGLEDHLGVRLLNRTTRKMSMTQAGHIYLEHCRSVLEQVTVMEERLGEQATAPKGMPRGISMRIVGSWDRSGPHPTIPKISNANPISLVISARQESSVT